MNNVRYLTILHLTELVTSAIQTPKFIDLDQLIDNKGKYIFKNKKKRCVIYMNIYETIQKVPSIT